MLGDASAPYTTFYFTEDRSRAGPEQWFAGYRGWLVSDAYIVYELLGEESLGRIQLAACHVHARRKFDSLHVLGPTLATSRALGYFQRLLGLEDQNRISHEDSLPHEKQRNAAWEWIHRAGGSAIAAADSPDYHRRMDAGRSATQIGYIDHDVPPRR